VLITENTKLSQRVAELVSLLAATRKTAIDDRVRMKAEVEMAQRAMETAFCDAVDEAVERAVREVKKSRKWTASQVSWVYSSMVCSYIFVLCIAQNSTSQQARKTRKTSQNNGFLLNIFLALFFLFPQAQQIETLLRQNTDLNGRLDTTLKRYNGAEIHHTNQHTSHQPTSTHHTNQHTSHQPTSTHHTNQHTSSTNTHHTNQHTSHQPTHITPTNTHHTSRSKEISKSKDGGGDR